MKEIILEYGEYPFENTTGLFIENIDKINQKLFENILIEITKNGLIISDLKIENGIDDYKKVTIINGFISPLAFNTDKNNFFKTLLHKFEFDYDNGDIEIGDMLIEQGFCDVEVSHFSNKKSLSSIQYILSQKFSEIKETTENYIEKLIN